MPADSIPEDIMIDLAGTDIGTSIKISLSNYQRMLHQLLQIETL